MNAIDFLLNEHTTHRELLDQVEQDPSTWDVLRKEIIHHVNIEEAILYPNLLKVKVLENIVREAWEEHSLCMQLVQEMDDPEISAESWSAKFKTLKKLLLSHLDDEEERLFPKIRSLASEEFLNDVGEQMVVHKVATPTENIIYPDVPDSHKLV